DEKGKDAPQKTPAEMIAEALKPVTDGFTKFNERLDAFEQKFVAKPEKPETRENYEPTSVLDNEDAAFSQRLTPVFLRQLELEARVVKSDIKAEYTRAGYGDLWDQFEKEIDDVLNGSQLATTDASWEPLST